jgi:ABC-type nitrate/sulfonate/bicarbonate transport system permease component
MSGRGGRFFARICWPSGISVTALLLWEAAVRELHVRSIILPPPSEIFVVIFQRRELLLTYSWPSLYLTVLGFALSVVAGVLVAVVIIHSSIARKGFYPIIVVSQNILKIAIAALFVASFGTGMTSNLQLTVLITFFPMTIKPRWDSDPSIGTHIAWPAPSRDQTGYLLEGRMAYLTFSAGGRS